MKLSGDGWLLAPADHPLLDASVVGTLITAWGAAGERIVVPAYRGRRGHPTIFPWRLAAEVFGLPGDLGLNALMRRHANEVDEVDFDAPAVVADLDTPEDYARLQAELDGRRQ